jgi:acetyl esterase
MVMDLSRDALRRLAGKPIVVDGNTLDVQTQVMLDSMRRLGIVQSDDVERSRREMEDDKDAVAPVPPAMESERDVFIGELRARIYRPKTASSVRKPGMLVFFHGGGFVCGSITSHEEAVKVLAHESGVVVCSVDYRLGPEHMFPAAVDDAVAAYAWAREHAGEFGADPTRVGVGGDSAGGNLSAVACHMCKARSVPQPSHQLLIYPAIDWSRSCESHKTFAKGFFLEDQRTHWFEARYLNRVEERDDPRASPMKFADFSNLAPATIVTAGFDILRDEGAKYAAMLERAGNQVDFCVETSLIHGFFNMGGAVTLARAANARIAARLHEALG